MLSNIHIITVCILSSLCFILLFLLKYTSSRKKNPQLEKAFVVIYILLIFWILGITLQLVFSNKYNINPIYFDYFVYINICFLPVAFFFLSLIFAKTKIRFQKWYPLLFVIPTISLFSLWTNDFHHLFYKVYSTSMANNVVGISFYIHFIYTYSLLAVSLYILIKYSIKNSGLFSKQAILIFVGTSIPIVTNLLGYLDIVPMSIYVTPISFTITILCIALAIFKFSLLRATPIALQRIVDRISDSYIVLNENYEISNFNQTFINTFEIRSSSEILGADFKEIINNNTLDFNKFKDAIEEVKNNDKTITFELFISTIKKYFNIEITSIIVNNQFLGILILFKDISQHIHDMKILKDNQNILMENERLASLGQLIGGIAHNLKTPIMSIAGAAEGLNDLIKEYESSIGDPEVTIEDHHDIAKDMTVWTDKIKEYTAYMSDIITTVKGQAVNLGADDEVEFTIKELINRVNILMKHELKHSLIYLNVSMKTDENTTIHGDINSLVQVLNNMISNSIQAYNGKVDQNIDVQFKTDNNNLIISIQDYAGGLAKKVQDRLFKEMITTKGKNGTGLGLYMSYSNIKARFNGDITFETSSIGTTFNIIIPL